MSGEFEQAQGRAKQAVPDACDEQRPQEDPSAERSDASAGRLKHALDVARRRFDDTLERVRGSARARPR